MKSRQAKEDDGKKEFRLVRIKNPEGFAPGSTAVGADLGIFIARSPQAEVGCPGYYVAHIVQDGVVKRFVARPRQFSDFKRFFAHMYHLSIRTMAGQNADTSIP